jgi:FkbM family methyltransferase
MSFFARWRSSPFHLIRPQPFSFPKEFTATWGGSLVRRRAPLGHPEPDNYVCVPSRIPTANDTLFEWHSLACAIRDARDRFVFVELGAGHGKWSVSAALVCRRRGLPCDVIAVEAEPTHYKMMKAHFEDNGLDWREHTLIEAAVAPEAGEVHFTVGAADAWWGQAILPTPDYGYGAIEGVSVKSVPAVTVSSILETVDRVDLIDMDIQGAEAGVIAASVEVLGKKVRRLHIGTHSAEVEAQIRATLSRAGWRPRWDFPCESEVRTPYGRVLFEDGVQAWRNSRL